MKRVNITDAGRAVIRRLNAARLAGFQQFAEALTEGGQTAEEKVAEASAAIARLVRS